MKNYSKNFQKILQLILEGPYCLYQISPQSMCLVPPHCGAGEKSWEHESLGLATLHQSNENIALDIKIISGRISSTLTS